MDNRIQQLQNYLNKEGIEAILITNPSNIFYLTSVNNFDIEKGFALLVSQKDFYIITSKFYQCRLQSVPEKNLIYVQRGQSFSQHIAAIAKQYTQLAFELEDLKYSTYRNYKKALRGIKFIPYANIVEIMRAIKDPQEITLIKKSAAITDKTMAQIIKLIKPGVTELYLKRKVLEIMQDLGAQSCSFDPIIASAKFSADPHYEGSNKKIKIGEMVIIDIGARYKNYDSDLTRTVFVGQAPTKFKKLYELVLQVQQKALNDCKLNTSVQEIFNNTVKNFQNFKEDQYFTHGLGHGVGIDIHELPSLSPAGQGTLQNGMVFTVEPGLYHPNYGGIRIEDLCHMNQTCQLLSKSPKTLIELT